MITIEEIKNYMVEKNIITNLAGVFRANNKDFVESESRYHATIKTLRVELPENMKPTLDEYIAACELDIISLVAYAGYLGFRVNLENYHSPVGVHFLHLDTIDYVKDHLMGHFPINYENAKVRDAFYEALPEACKEIHDNVIDYYCHFECAGPKLAHYAGYIIGNQILPWIEPGYREDYAQTCAFKEQTKKYFGYLPL